MENVRVNGYDVEQQMLSYLRAKFTQYLKDEKTYGSDDRMVMKDLDRLLACKDMVEVIIGAPVNLQRDGKITIGF